MPILSAKSYPTVANVPPSLPSSILASDPSSSAVRSRVTSSRYAPPSGTGNCPAPSCVNRRSPVVAAGPSMDFMAVVGFDTRVGFPAIVSSRMSRTMESAPPCQSSVGSCRAYAQLFIHPMSVPGGHPLAFGEPRIIPRHGGVEVGAGVEPLMRSAGRGESGPVPLASPVGNARGESLFAPVGAGGKDPGPFGWITVEIQLEEVRAFQGAQTGAFDARGVVPILQVRRGIHADFAAFGQGHHPLAVGFIADDLRVPPVRFARIFHDRILRIRGE